MIAFVLLIAAMNSRAATAQSAPVVDWTSIDYGARTASGMLDATPVTFSWSANGSVPTTYFSGNAPWFNSSAFTPSFESTDGMEILARRSAQGVPTYTISFDSPVSNPVLHIASIASTLTFIGSTPQRVSGDERFSVSGNQVIGVDYNDPNGIDANGTVVVPGTHLSLSFTAEYFGPAPTNVDGIVIQAGGMPGLNLVGLEVIQVVQDWANTAKLVAGKRTAVRAHIADPAATAPAGLTFRLYAFGGASLNQPLNPPFVDNVQSPLPLVLPAVVDRVTRNLKHNSAIFRLPESWTSAGAKKFVLEGTSRALDSCLDHAPPTSNDCSVTINFVARTPIVMHLIRAHFDQIGGSSYVTQASDLAAVCSQIERRIPTHDVICINEPNPIVFDPSATAPTSREILDETRARKLWGSHCWWPLCKDFYMTVTKFKACEDSGCNAGTVGGKANFPSIFDPSSRSAWAVSASMDSSTAPHELGHNLDLQHTTNQDLDLFDITKDGTCGEEARLNAAYPPLSSYYFPYYHGIAPDIAPWLGPIGSEQERIFGYDSELDEVIPDSQDPLMSGCRLERWPDLGSYNKVFEDLVPIEAPSELPTDRSTTSYFLVKGTVDVETNDAALDPVNKVAFPFVPPVTPPGEFTLVAHSAGAPISHPLELSYSPNNPRVADFSAFVEHDPDVTGFTIQRGTVALVHLGASPSPPEITITGPTPGAQYVNEDVALTWDASDADGDLLSFRVEYSPDGGMSWVNLSLGWPAPPFTISSSLIESSPNALFRVTALDGFHSTSDTLAGPIGIFSGTIHADGFE